MLPSKKNAWEGNKIFWIKLHLKGEQHAAAKQNVPSSRAKRVNVQKKKPWVAQHFAARKIHTYWYDHTGQILRGTAPEWVRNLTFHVIFFGGMLTNIYSKVNHIWIWRLANKAGKMGQDSNMSSCGRIPSLADSVPIPDTLRRFLPSVIVPWGVLVRSHWVIFERKSSGMRSESDFSRHIFLEECWQTFTSKWITFEFGDLITRLEKCG